MELDCLCAATLHSNDDLPFGSIKPCAISPSAFVPCRVMSCPRFQLPALLTDFACASLVLRTKLGQKHTKARFSKKNAESERTLYEVLDSQVALPQ